MCEYLCVWYAHVNAGAYEIRKREWALGAGVSGGYKPSDEGALQEQTVFLTVEQAAQPSVHFLAASFQSSFIEFFIVFAGLDFVFLFYFVYETGLGLII